MRPGTRVKVVGYDSEGEDEIRVNGLIGTVVRTNDYGMILVDMGFSPVDLEGQGWRFRPEELEIIP